MGIRTRACRTVGLCETPLQHSALVRGQARSPTGLGADGKTWGQPARPAPARSAAADGGRVHPTRYSHSVAPDSLLNPTAQAQHGAPRRFIVVSRLTITIGLRDAS